MALMLRSRSASVASGETGAEGRFSARLAPGTYEISYRLEGYVPYTSDKWSRMRRSLLRRLELVERHVPVRVENLEAALLLGLG